MRYHLELISRGGGGLEKTLNVKSEDIPRIGDHVSYDGEGFLEAEVYEVYRPIRRLNRDGRGTSHVQNIPTVRALIKKRSR